MCGFCVINTSTGDMLNLILIDRRESAATGGCGRMMWQACVCVCEWRRRRQNSWRCSSSSWLRWWWWWRRLWLLPPMSCLCAEALIGQCLNDSFSHVCMTPFSPSEKSYLFNSLSLSLSLSLPMISCQFFFPFIVFFSLSHTLSSIFIIFL